jgi:hypothetical protein
VVEGKGQGQGQQRECVFFFIRFFVFFWFYGFLFETKRRLIVFFSFAFVDPQAVIVDQPTL